MKKNTYSIILMENVVNEIDRLAAQEGTSRSNLINRILAEYVSCKTPEQQRASIFSILEEQMKSLFRIQAAASDSMLSLHSALQYKYRPTVQYRVELLRQPKTECIGWLRISCRTQSQALLQMIQSFFQFWMALEQAYYPDCRTAGLYQLQENGLLRCLRLQTEQDEIQIGTQIAQYIRQFDALLKQYLALESQMPVSTLEQHLQQKYIQMQAEHTVCPV